MRADICELHWTFIGQIDRRQRNFALHNTLSITPALQPTLAT